MKALTYSIINVIGLIIMLIVNFIEIFAPINNNSIADISAGYGNLLVPVNMTFSVAWMVIYLLLVFAIDYQVYQSINQKGYVYPKKVGWLLFINMLLNAAWVVAFANNMMGVSLLLILGVLVTLVMIYRKTQNNGADGATKIAISVYLGWITVATILNIYAFLISAGSADYNTIFGIDATIIGIIILAILTYLGYHMITHKNDIFYSIPILWAFIGIAMKNYESNMMFAIVAIVMAVILAILIISKLMKKDKRKKR
jgi:translocator protein